MNQLTHANQFMPSMQELEQLTNLCRSLGTCPFYAKLGPAGVLAIWLTARELKLPPMMCLNGGLHCIEGKVTLSAQLMNMMIVNAGHKVTVIYLNSKGCRLKFTRCDRRGPDADFEYEFNEEDAKRAGYFGRPGPQGTWERKPKDNWVSHPRDMYYSRALSGGSRKHMPDVLMQCYVMGELEDVEAEIVSGAAPKNDVGTPPAIDTPEPPKIDHVPNETIEMFKVKYGIGNDNDHDRYINALSEKCKKSKEDMIVCAVMNEKGFLDAFDKWAQKLPKITENTPEKQPKSPEIYPEKQPISQEIEQQAEMIKEIAAAETAAKSRRR